MHTGFHVTYNYRSAAVFSRMIARLLGVYFFVAASSIHAQEVEPRRWSHLPTGMNFGGVGVIYTDGDILLDPVIEVEDVTVRLTGYGGKYIRPFELLGKSARIDLKYGYVQGRWKGILQGEPASTYRSGAIDPSIRLAVNLYGAPPLQGAEYVTYRRQLENETIVGAAVIVSFPLGQYFNDKLINLGENRYTIRPQLGIVHSRKDWTLELTTTTFLYTDNDELFGESLREQKPLYAAQVHIIYTINRGLWVSASGAYGYGGESKVNGVNKDDRQERYLYALNLGISITKRLGYKVSWVAARTLTDLGSNTDTIAMALAYSW